MEGRPNRRNKAAFLNILGTSVNAALNLPAPF